MEKFYGPHAPRKALWWGKDETDQRIWNPDSMLLCGVTFSGYFVFIRRCFNSISSPLISLGGNWKVLHIRLYCSQKKLFHIPILSQFSIRLSLQWRRKKMCLFSFSNQWETSKVDFSQSNSPISFSKGDSYIVSVDMIRLKLWSLCLCMKLKESSNRE